MVDFSKLFDFFLDSNQRLSKRLSIVVLVLLLTVFIDRLFKLSDNYITSQKLEQVAKIEQLLRTDTTTTLQPQLRDLEQTVLRRGTAWDYLSDCLSASVSFIKNPPAQILTINQNPINTVTAMNRSVFWHTLTACWPLLGLMLLLLCVPFLNKEFSIELLLVLAFVEAILALAGYLVALLFALMPLLYHPVVNYALNFMGSLGIAYALGRGILASNIKSLR